MMLTALVVGQLEPGLADVETEVGYLDFHFRIVHLLLVLHSPLDVEEIQLVRSDRWFLV